MSRRSPVRSWRRSQDSRSPQAIALKVMLLRQVGAVGDSAEYGSSATWTECAAIFEASLPAFSMLALVRARTGEALVPPFWVAIPAWAGAILSLVCFSFIACGGAI